MSDFYQDHFKNYHQRTFSIDPASFLDSFIEHLPAGVHILDIGCGSGRDLCWLKKRGFIATGFERSAGLAAIARKMSGCTVIEGDFETYDLSTLSADAVLLSGSLVHVPHEKLSHILKRICRTMKGREKINSGIESPEKPGHLIYLSLKKGRGCYSSPDGRCFYLWTHQRLFHLFRNHGFEIVSVSQKESLLGNGDVWLAYCLHPPSIVS